MNIFYPDIESLDAYTLSLDCLAEQVKCRHCHQSGQFVSHGFVYKQYSSIDKEPVGKRVLCSNRYGRSGCGKTIRLYVAHRFPCFRYGAIELWMFLSQLILGASVPGAYQFATKQSDTRNGWRWMNRLIFNLLAFRRVFKPTLSNLSCWFKHRSRRLQLLLPTLLPWFSNKHTNPCSAFQITHQVCFI